MASPVPSGNTNTDVGAKPGSAQELCRAIRPVQQTVARPPLLPVSRKLLLSFYLIVPVGVLIPLLDRFLLDRVVLEGLPDHPDQLFLWTLVFNVPHLVASELLLLDGEYVRYYRRPLLLALGAVALFWVACLLVPPLPALWIATAVTMYHVIAQQVGITRMMGGGDPGPALVYYKISGVLVILLAYAQIIPPAFRINGLSLKLSWLTAICLILSTACAVSIWRRLTGWQARLYLLANQAMFVAVVPLASTGYAFFMILIPRVVHDLSAFTFYIVHDTNRNKREPRALLYRMFGFTRLPAWVLLPSASIGIGSVLTAIDPASVWHPVALISLFHYIMEAVTWRRGGLHRRSIALA